MKLSGDLVKTSQSRARHARRQHATMALLEFQRIYTDENYFNSIWTKLHSNEMMELKDNQSEDFQNDGREHSVSCDSTHS